MKDRVVITGVGLVDTLGTYPMECFENMISDHYEHPVDFKTDIESLKGLVCFKSRDVNYTIPDGIRKPVFGSLSTASKNALHVVQQAMGDIDVPMSRLYSVRLQERKVLGIQTSVIRWRVVNDYPPELLYSI